jgi:hypothetical protein
MTAGRHLAWSLLLLGAACRNGGPEAGQFVVVLAQAESAAEAEDLRSRISGEVPELADAWTRAVAGQDSAPVHLVLSRAFGSRPEAEDLRRRLEETQRTRLEVIEVPAALSAAVTTKTPACRPALLGWLPAGEDGLELRSVRWEEPGAGPVALGSVSAREPWDERLDRISCRQRARAVWMEPGGDSLFLFACQGPADELLEGVHRTLMASREPPRPVSAPRARKKGRPPPSPRPAASVAKIIEEAMPLPAPVPFSLPWGEAPAHVFSVSKPAGRGHPEAEWTACLASLPEGKGVLLAVARDEKRLRSALARRWLGPPRGLAASALLRGWDAIRPYLQAQGETLAALGVERLGDFARAQGAAVEAELEKIPVDLAAFCGGGVCWTARKFEFSAPGQAQEIYDRVLVGPRADFVRRVLSDKKFRVSYDVGLSFQEIGSAKAWQLRGAGGGKWRELYFTLDRSVVLLQAPEASPGSAAVDLAAKAYLIIGSAPGAGP